MADLGLYNFIKNSVAKGQTKEEVTAALRAAGNALAAIDDAFTALESGTTPIFKSRVHERDFFVETPAQREERLWEAFRNSFWKYALIFFGCALFTNTPLPLFNIFLVIYAGVTIGAFIITAWNMTVAVRGKGSVGLSALSIFSFPLTYLVLYRLMRQSGWPISIGRVEKVLVALAGLGALAWLVLLVVTLLSH